MERSETTSVRVAVRIRPQISRELIEQCPTCTQVTPGEPQIWVGKEKAFTYDYVFDTHSTQEEIYETCVKDLVEGCFSGYNATVLAYGQTGSGKTYTMGTGFEPGSFNLQPLSRPQQQQQQQQLQPQQQPLPPSIQQQPSQQDQQEQHNETTHGIVPRAVRHLFEGIQKRQNEAHDKNQPAPKFKMMAQFIELYNEDIVDLLDETHNMNNAKMIRIHQENGNIQMAGVISRPVNSINEAFECLRVGALSRTTASTKMNTQSSRSHAIFTLSIHQTRVIADAQDVETLSAKFHFVDLAGSERLKRTGATGERAKEGISINTGLLCLGNVISALGDPTKKASHIPYRDSKLTRLLQDSLGGNSQTLMIACISPSEPDSAESLSTLRYANRAKNITNKVMVNADTSSNTIALLRREIEELRKEIADLKSGKRLVSEDGTEYISDTYHENNMLKSEVQSLKTRNRVLQEANERLIAQNTEVMASEFWAKVGNDNESIEAKDIVRKCLTEIEQLKMKLLETNRMQNRRQTFTRLSLASSAAVNLASVDPEISSEKVLEDARREVDTLKKLSQIMNNGNSSFQSSLRTASVRRANTDGHSGSGGDDDDDEDEDNSLAITHDIDDNVSSERDVDGDDETDDREYSDDDEVEDDGDVGDEEEDDYDDNKNSKMSQEEMELALLNEDISTKELLIAELEKHQRKMESLKQNYEAKLIQLQNQITEIQKERDQVLQKLTQSGSKTDEKSKKVHEEYDRKIKLLQMDVKKLDEIRREHLRYMKRQAQEEQKVRQLRNEVSELKRQKVNVMNKMKEDCNKYRISQLESNKRIVQLTKQERLKDVKIKNLELENNRLKQMLKRKEVELKTFKTKNKISGSRFTSQPRHLTGEKARRMTRTPQELLFEINSRN